MPPRSAFAPAAVLQDLHTRMVLLGRGWTLADYMRATGMNLSQSVDYATALG
jgi:hypothetical protein